MEKVMKPCGHVVCKTCTDNLLVDEEKTCLVCDTKLVKKDIIPLQREGSCSTILDPLTNLTRTLRDRICERRVGGGVQSWCGIPRVIEWTVANSGLNDTHSPRNPSTLR